MSDPYQRTKAGKLTFKGGELGVVKSLDKKKKKNKKQKRNLDEGVKDGTAVDIGEEVEEGGGEQVYTIDAAKKMKYEELFPVETKKFGYDPINLEKTKYVGGNSVERALDDRVKKKADRYCK
ncbi:hypothetical protein ZOSMA_133G00310 [Zostera marina]|uniref:Uncharacterized protein n=1 Tax=Zostera marina TaxID=29655 RepID=A0A0K9PYV3_ZOSMR|nr:hypothetical protein ZOSMA_133G00310 [Zostera marina]